MVKVGSFPYYEAKETKRT